MREISFSITAKVENIKEMIYRIDYIKLKSSMPPRTIKNKIKSK